MARLPIQTLAMNTMFVKCEPFKDWEVNLDTQFMCSLNLGIFWPLDHTQLKVTQIDMITSIDSQEFTITILMLNSGIISIRKLSRFTYNIFYKHRSDSNT